MPKQAPCFSPKALAFFRQLAKNNKREWFQPRKDEFDTTVRKPMMELLNHLCDCKGGLRSFAADYVQADPAKSLYRIYRDTRFSKDKTPYKTHIAAHFQHGKIEKNRGAGFYFAVSHEGVEIGAGLYMPDKEQLTAFRSALMKHHAKFRKMLEDKTLVKLYGPAQGDKTRRPPADIPADHPAADLLSLKQIYFFSTLPAKTATDGKFATEVLKRFAAAEPFIAFINNAIISAMADEDGEPDRPRRPEPMF